MRLGTLLVMLVYLLLDALLFDLTIPELLAALAVGIVVIAWPSNEKVISRIELNDR